MENKVYTQNELKAQNILTMDYVLNLEPGDFIEVLDLKAQARNCLRVPRHSEFRGRRGHAGAGIRHW